MQRKRRDEAHTILVDNILYHFGSRSDVRVWPRDVGLGISLYTGLHVKWGLTGESDIQGVVAPNGRMLCIECKTGAGKLSPKQEIYKRVMVKFGAIYVLAYATDKSPEAIQMGVDNALTDFEKQL